MKGIFLWFWCLPQNLLGLFVKIFTKAERMGDHYEYRIKRGSVCLGEYVFLAPFDRDSERILRHEMGHRQQSRRLGWLYLLVIGLPSVIWNCCFEQYRQKHGISYYDFYTEAWADKLGGIRKE